MGGAESDAPKNIVPLTETDGLTNPPGGAQPPCAAAIIVISQSRGNGRVISPQDGGQVKNEVWKGNGQEQMGHNKAELNKPTSVTEEINESLWAPWHIKCREMYEYANSVISATPQTPRMFT